MAALTCRLSAQRTGFGARLLSLAKRLKWHDWNDTSPDPRLINERASLLREVMALDKDQCDHLLLEIDPAIAAKVFSLLALKIKIL